MRNYFREMLDMLTGAYNRRDLVNDEKGRPLETNIGRLFRTFSWGLELVHEHCDKILLWDNLDNAQGQVLDRYGKNFGVAREGTPDAFYRLLIKVKMLAQLSGGDIDTVIDAASALFDVEPADMDLEEIFPAKIWLYVDQDLLTAEKIELGDLIATVMKRIIATGVGIRIFFRVYRQASGSVFVNMGTATRAQYDIPPSAHHFEFSKPLYINTAVTASVHTIARTVL